MKHYSHGKGLAAAGIIVIVCLILSAYFDDGIQLSKEKIGVRYNWATEKPTIPENLKWVVDDPVNIGYYLKSKKRIVWSVEIPTNGRVEFVSPVTGKEYRVMYSTEQDKVTIEGEFYYKIDGSYFRDKENNALAPEDYERAVRYGRLFIQLKKPR